MWVSYSISEKFGRLMALVAITMVGLSMGPLAWAQDDPRPVVEWEKRQNAEERLRAYGTDILGDGIDPHTGTIMFEHTDVSLPGNFGLEVAVRRKLSQGVTYKEGVNVEFGDWELDVPKISAVTLSAVSSGWAKSTNRCSNSLSSNFPTYTGSTPYVYGEDYSHGIKFQTPDGGGELLQNKITSGGAKAPHWPSSAKYVSNNNWYFTCISGISGGGQGFIGHAPNGHKYYFNRFISRNAWPLSMQAAASGTYNVRTQGILAATKVTDAHGNEVNYVYDPSDRLIEINANDGRKITLHYSGSSKLISEVRANNRKWEYSYRATDFKLRAWQTSIESQRVLNRSVLASVKQPDSKSWVFDLDYMATMPAPAVQCLRGEMDDLIITHPYGVSGTFKLAYQFHRNHLNAMVSKNPRCTGEPETIHPRPGPPDNYPLLKTRMETLSVIQKKLSHSSISPLTWTYNYEQDDSAAGTSASDPTNTTTVTEPNGRQIKYYHFWTGQPLGGKLDRKKILGDAPETTSYDYLLESSVGWQFLRSGLTPSEATPVRQTETVTDRDGDTFTTVNSYGTNQSSGYSWGQPKKTVVSSDVPDTPTRTTVTSYEHLTAYWILGLPLTQTVNNRPEPDIEYMYYTSNTGDGAAGKKRRQYRHGQLAAKFAYHDDGTMSRYRDANDYLYYADEWKRGTPQKITRPDDTSIRQTVDDNGWVTSTVQAKGLESGATPSDYTTEYEYDSMGRMELLNPPGDHYASTSIAYEFGDSITQRITKGKSETLIWYDRMFRPKLERTRDTDDWDSRSYIQTRYDDAGQVEFKSFRSSSYTSTVGTNFIYDDLGRLLSEEETVTPYASKSYGYLDDGRTKVKDADSNITITYKNGHGEVGRIEQPEDTTTLIDRNEWGQIESVTQLGDSNINDITHTYQYDSQQRLCRYYTPSGNATLYDYDAAGQMVARAMGMDVSTCLDAESFGQGEVFTYDAMGRLMFTDYASTSTPDTGREYDANGNLTALYRDENNEDETEWYDDIKNTIWRYDYDELNNLEHEQLWMDRRVFEINHVYSPDGSLFSSSRDYHRETWPTDHSFDHSIEYSRDGLGRGTGVTLHRVDGSTETLATGGEYWPEGPLKSLSYDNGIKFTQTLTPRLQPHKLKASNDANTVKPLNRWYEYNKRGLVSDITDWTRRIDDRTYEYDGQGRLTNATGDWGAVAYQYDSVGNLRRKQFGFFVVDINYNNLNQVESSVNPATGTRNYVHDDRGNVRWRGHLRFGYSGAQRPTSLMSDESGTLKSIGAYRYDGHGRRVKSITKTDEGDITRYNIFDASGTLVWVVQLHPDGGDENHVTNYVGMDGQTIARVKSVGTRINYVDEVTFLHNDHLGSAVAGTDASGAIVFKERYLPFGGTQVNNAANENQAGFTGHIKDTDTGLNYMQARYYDPEIGRFLSHDAMSFTGSGLNPGYFNRYAYTHNNPINMIDPTGNCNTGTNLKSGGGSGGCKTLFGGGGGSSGGGKSDPQEVSYNGDGSGASSTSASNGQANGGDDDDNSGDEMIPEFEDEVISLGQRVVYTSSVANDNISACEIALGVCIGRAEMIYDAGREAASHTLNEACAITYKACNFASKLVKTNPAVSGGTIGFPAYSGWVRMDKGIPDRFIPGTGYFNEYTHNPVIPKFPGVD